MKSMWTAGWIGVALLALGCADNAPPRTGPAREFTAILITDVGGLGDKGFNDSGWAGCLEAQKRLADQGKKIEVKFIESEEQTDYTANLNTASERADVVIALGFLIADAVEQVARYNPATHYIFIDGQVKGANIASFDFHANEAAFLAGLLASYVTQTGVAGVTPGMDIPPVEAFAAGFRAGFLTGGRTRGREVKILSTTIGSFDDPVKAKSIAVTLINQNADILFQLAGNSGLGVIEAVEDQPGRVFAIGVDIDQDDLAPGKILTSVLKRMDRIVADQITAAYEGKFQGGIYTAGLKDDAVGLSDMRHTRSLVPEEAHAVMRRAREAIVTGKIAVPKTYAELEKFVPPVLEK